MRDYGIIWSAIQKFNTSDRRTKGAFYGLRKMFWTYLNKLNVPFFDPCCEDAPTATYPVRYNADLQRLEFFNGTEWADITGIAETTTTTTSSTTSTTTEATTTTTTTSSTTTTTTV